MIRLIPALLFSAYVALQTAVPSTLTGDWTIAGDVEGVAISEACTFTQTDAALTGSCSGQGKKWETAGTIDGRKVTFHHGAEYEGQALILTYSGTLTDEGAVKGVIDVDPMNVSGVFTATKAVSKADKP